MKMHTLEEIADFIIAAKISDSLKERITLKLSLARKKLSPYEFNNVFNKTKEFIIETEKKLN